MRHRAIRRAGAAISVLVTGIAFAACGSGYKPSASARTGFVDARAQALCLVKDKNYTSENALETAYTTAEAAQISAKDNAWLKNDYEHDAKLRGDITAKFDATCPGDPSTPAGK